MTIRSLCIYCGSSPGLRAEYTGVAIRFVRLLAASGIGLVYGGASKGLMGVIADEMLAAGGKVCGIIPRALKDQEIAHTGLDELHVVASMHERKTLMAEKSDGFVALPGGFGTLEEIVEVLTWGQLRLHAKPCGLLNVSNYFDQLLAFLDHATAEGFVKDEHRAMLLVEQDPERLLAKFCEYRAPRAVKWLS